jgi:phage-related protein (TIGR01555 family)
LGFLDRIAEVFTRTQATDEAAPVIDHLPPVYQGGQTRAGELFVYRGIRGEIQRAKTHTAIDSGSVHRTASELFENVGLINRIIRMPAVDMVSNWVTVQGVDDVEPVEDLAKKMRAKAKVRKALIYARQYGGGMIYLATEGDSSQPLEVMQPGELIALVPLSPEQIEPATTAQIVGDMTRPDWGLPDRYIVRGSDGETRIIHHTRLIRIRGDSCSIEELKRRKYWDNPVIRKGVASIDRLVRAWEGVSDTMTQGVLDIYRLKGHSDLILGGRHKEAESRVSAIMAMKDVHGFAVIDSEDEYMKKGADLGGFQPGIVELRLAVCSEHGIAATILFGDSASGLNATGETETLNYIAMLTAEAEDKLEEPLQELYRRLAQSAGLSDWEQIEVVMKQIGVSSPMQEADIEAKKAAYANTYANMGAVDVGDIARDLQRRGVYPLTEEDIKEADIVAEALQQTRGEPATSELLSPPNA